MQRPNGTNNQSGYPLKSTGGSQPANGGNITTKVISPSATQVGHRQVNPGSNKK